MEITQFPLPVGRTESLLRAGLRARFPVLSACSSAGSQRLIRLMASVHHLVGGTCEYGDRERTSSNRRSRRIRKG